MAKLRPPSSRRFTTTTIFIIHLLLLLSPHSLTVTATSTHHRHQKQQQQQQRIKNIVVLVMENRSFDHMLGWMKRSINPNIDGLIGNECNRRITTDPKSPLICVTDDARFVDPDPGHSFEDIRAQVFGNSAFPDMSGFVQQALNMSFSSSDEDRLLPETVMRAFSPDDLPIYETLVREYAVFDRWFASLPASTQPNRLFVYSATSAGATSNDKLRLASGFPQRTIFDSIHDSGLDFGVYSQHIPTTLFFRSLRRPGSLLRKFHRWGTFFDHAKSGLLRDLTVLEPRYFDLPGFGGAADDDHPSHDVGNGQRLVKEVYEALRASPQWNTTLLVITYDEHGGFYDHVPTPYQGVPNPDGINGHGPDGFKFDRLGVRVPTIMVSPWIKKGTVVNRAKGPTPTSEYEHSSIPATIKKMFNLNADFLTKRDAWAGTFEHVVDGLDSPRTDCPEVLPDPKPIRKTKANPGKTLTEFQSELVQLASALSGDILHLHKAEDPEEDPIRKMTVGEADEYINKALSKVFGSAEEDAAVVSDGDGTDAEDDELCPTPAP